MQEYEANTAAVLLVGPFVAIADGVTPVTNVTLGGADHAELMKHNGTTFVDLTSDSRTWTHKEGGWYNLTLGTGDMDTEGRFKVVIMDTDVYLPVWEEGMILSQAAWASKYGAKDSGYMDVDVTALSTSTTAADNLEAVLLGTGHTADVDLSARRLLLNCDTDVALEILSSDDSAIKAVSSATGKHGMELQATAAGGDGLNCLGNTTGDGFHLVGGATGHGISTAGGSTSGQGIFAAAQDGNGNGILCRGDPTAGSTGDGFRIEGGTDGHGIHAKGGSGAGAGIYSEAQANNDAGMELVKHGTGVDLDADEISTIDTVVDGIQTDLSNGTDGLGALKSLIDTAQGTLTKLEDTLEDDGGTQRFTENALEEAPTGGSAPSAATIADAVWDEDITGHETADTAGRVQSAKFGDQELTSDNQYVCKGLSGDELFSFDLTRDDVATRYNPYKREAA